MFLFQHTFDAAQAQIFSGPVSAAMGNTGRTGAEVSESIFQNPATAALAKGFDGNFIFRDGYWGKNDHESGMAVSLVESDAENFAPGGFAYVMRRRHVNGQAWNEQYGFGALGQSLSPYFTFGLGFYYLSQKEDGLPNTHTQINGSVGTLFTFNPRFGVAYVLYNPVQPDEDIPDYLKAIMSQALSVNYLFAELMRVTVDIARWEKQNPDKKGIIGMGTEAQLGEFGILRFGYEIDDIRKRNSFTFGLGFNGPRLKMNYALVKPMRATDGAMHSVDLRVPF